MTRIKSSHQKTVVLFICLLAVGVLFQNCGQAGEVSLVNPEQPKITNETPDETTRVPFPEVPNLPDYKLKISSHKNYICEPFSVATQVTTGMNGLKAQLAFVTPNSDQELDFVRSLGAKAYWTNTSSLITRPTNSIFFSQVNVVPILFDQGFSTGANEYLEDTSGNKLVEWFGLKYETYLSLADADQEGFYKLASVSDDGVVIEAFLDNQWVQILDNDGAHSPRFKCQNELLYLDKKSKIKLRIYYNQGPRIKIANVLMFKHVGSNPPTPNTIVNGCEMNGSHQIYTNPEIGPSVGTEQYATLINNGWKVIPPQNFLLTDGEVNPCTVNNMNLVSTTDPQYNIEGVKLVSKKILEFSFATSIESESIVKLFDDSSGAPVLISQSLSHSVLQSDKHVHTIQLNEVIASKNYRMEITFRNISLNISNRADFLLQPTE